MPDHSPEILFAAIDLGSNSFRLEIGRYDHGQMIRVDYLKEAVRQGGSLDENRNLTPEAVQRGLKCLLRFSERIKGFPSHRVRAVATQTLREARNRDEFLALAKDTLGHEIEIVSGTEEARLIYQGANRFLPQSNERRLVLDIGGRSTEFILGQDFTIHNADSLRVGSVTWSLKYFGAGQLTEEAFYRGEIAAEAFLDSIAYIYKNTAWDTVYGASGTVGAIADILHCAGYAPDRITRKGLKWLRSTLIQAKHIDKLVLEGIKEDRKPVIGGGLCVLLAIFDLLDIEELLVAKGALRHGLLYEMAEQDLPRATDLRKNSIQRLAHRFNVDKLQAERVAKTATHLFNQVLQTQPLKEQPTHLQELTWAAQLHEIGGAISHTDAHRHSAYILEHAEVMGFSQNELHRLSLLVLGHKGKLKKLDDNFTLNTHLDDTFFITELLCLRLAVIFCHSRSAPDLDTIQLNMTGSTFCLQVSKHWQETHPQTNYLLEEEILAWQKNHWEFVMSQLQLKIA